MTVTAPSVTLPPIVSREEWLAARLDLLAQEKELTHQRDRVSAARRRLPMVEVTEPYAFQGTEGPVTLLDLFAGRTQLVVQHFMFSDEQDHICAGCSMMADYLGPQVHLHARDTSLALISRGSIESLQAFRARMGWDYTWVSSGDTTFNQDFGYTISGEDHPGLSTFLRDGDRVYHTWSTHNRGAEYVMGALGLLDLTAYGRQEEWEDSPEGWPQTPNGTWWRLHDEYGTASETHGCCH
jgi:predicted dithiol-disulfide oxidoreductase (DUF899 family)